MPREPWASNRSRLAWQRDWIEPPSSGSRTRCAGMVVPMCFCHPEQGKVFSCPLELGDPTMEVLELFEQCRLICANMRNQVLPSVNKVVFESIVARFQVGRAS
jgi:hypothetical protein